MVQGNSSYKNFVFVSPLLIFGKTFLLRPEYAYFLIRYFLLEYPFKYALEYSLEYPPKCPLDHSLECALECILESTP